MQFADNAAIFYTIFNALFDFHDNTDYLDNHFHPNVFRRI
jgi:hypothetical protein